MKKFKLILDLRSPWCCRNKNCRRIAIWCIPFYSMHDHRHWDSKNSHLPSQHNRGYACILMVQWILSSVLLTSNVFYGIIPHHLLDITNNIHSISKANKIQTVGIRRLLCFCLLKPNSYHIWKHSPLFVAWTRLWCMYPEECLFLPEIEKWLIFIYTYGQWCCMR